MSKIMDKIVGAVALAFMGWLVLSSEKEHCEEEIKLWNNGKCPTCGKKWRARRFYMTGGTKAVAVDCYKCRKHAEFKYFDPIEDLT